MAEILRKTELVKFDYGEDAGRGFEGQTQDEMQVPFLTLLQDMSPQVTGAKGEAIAEAKPGKLFNTVTNEVLGDSVTFIPAHREHGFCRYVPRKQGGGFKGRLSVEDPVVVKARETAMEFGKYATPEGDELVETFYLYGVLARENGDLQPIVISFASTKIKVFKRWNTQISMFTIQTADGRKQKPPRYAHLLLVRTARQTNNKGTFYNLVLEPANGDIRGSLLDPSDPRFQAARALAEMVQTGKARAAEETQDVAASDDTGDVF